MSHKLPHIQKLLENRYYLRDEEGNLLEHDPNEMYCRVGEAVALAEKPEDQMKWELMFIDLMQSNKFLPNTPTLINAGKKRPGSFSACFVLPVEDSMEGIFKAVKDAAVIMKAGGGVGFNFGKLREKGALVKSTGHASSGPISFMKVFDSACETISQGGVRRGAMIGILPVWHPDIEEFIEMKADGKSFSNFNISVGITDAFMEAIEKDEDWYLIPPVYKDLQKIPTAYLKTINARSLWNKIVEQAHKTGDPGLFFLDTVNKAHPLNDEIESSNPCWSGSTKVWTVEHGWATFRELEKLGDTEVFSWDGSKIVTKMMRNPRQTAVNTRIVEVAVRGSGAKSGQVSYLRCTYNHQLYLKDGTKVLAKDLKPGDNLSSVYIHKANSKGYISASCNGCSELVHNIVMETPEGFHAHHKNEITSDNRRSNLELQELHTHMSDHKKGGKNPIHKLTAKGKNYLLTLPTDGKNNGRYNDFVDNKEVVRLRDEEKLSWKEVCSRVGLAPNVKTIKNRYQWGLEELQDNHTVISVEDCAFDSVYNGTVDDTHNYFVACGENDGILSANCGEIPLRPYESCNLGSINLMAYITDKGLQTQGMGMSQAYYFDWDALAKDIPTMVRFLDDVIDVNPFPLPEIDKASKESRKIGLGIMGWADCLIKMKIPYGSQISLDLAEELMDFIYEKANMASIKLGEEKGFFPLSDNYPIEGKPDQYRRNATLLTLPPTGTLSRIAGVSSGIEPIFAWRTHHKLEGHEYDETHWAYEDNWNEHIAGKPDYMKTANEIAPELHLRMQAAFQKYVDNSISKTINLPNDAPVDTVNEIYRRAWEMGLKGITIYRDGSKEYQPLNKIEPYKVNLNDFSKEEQKALIEEPSLDEIINKNRLRKRGPVAIGVTHKVDTGRGKIYITINYSEYHSEPVEVFIRLGHLSTPTEAALAEWSGRLISMLLKYNVPLESVMRQGNKVYADTTFWYNQQAFCSLPKLISHLLGFTFEEALDMADLDFDAFLENGDEYYEENEPIEEKEETTYGYCYHCGTYGMIGESGCKVCNNCGYEECG